MSQIHDRISINSICFPGATFSRQAIYWREMGARRVSLVLRHEDAAAAQAALLTGDYVVETLPHAFFRESSVERNDQTWRAARGGLDRTIDAAKALRARSIYLVTGGRASLTWEEAAECFRDAIAPCAARARAERIPLMIEDSSPLYADSHLAHSLRDTLTLAEMTELGVCIDFFACWTEAGLRESIKRAVPRCHIVQICDYVYGDRFVPSRAVPGDGAIPIERMIDWILDAGYTGTFDLELVGPRIDQEGHFAAACRAADNVGEILHSLGV